MGSQLRKREFHAVLVIVATVMLGFGLIVPAQPLFARSFGVSYAAVGWLSSGFAITRFLALPAGGPLVDALGERFTAILGVLIVGASSAAAGFAPSFLWLLVARSLGGFGSAWFITSLTSYTLGLVDPSEAGRAMGRFQAAFTGGIMLGPVAGGMLAQTAGLRTPFFVYAAACAASAVTAAALMGPRTVRKPAQQAKEPIPWRVRPYMVAVITNLALWAGYGASRGTLVPLYARDVLHASEGWIGLVLTVSTAAGFVVLPYAGRATDRSRRVVLVWGMAAAAALTVAVALSRTLWTLLAVAALLGAAQGYARVPVSALISDAVNRRNRGRAVAWHQAAGDLGQIAGAPLAGAVAAGAGFLAAFFVAAVPTLAAAALGALLLGARKGTVTTPRPLGRRFRRGPSTRCS